MSSLLDIFNSKIYFSPYAETGKRYHLKPFLNHPSPFSPVLNYYRSLLFFKKSTLKIISWYQKQTHNGHLDICSSFLTSSVSLPPGFFLDLSNFLFSSLTFLCHFFFSEHSICLGSLPDYTFQATEASSIHSKKQPVQALQPRPFRTFFSPILINMSYLFSLTRVSHLR